MTKFEAWLKIAHPGDTHTYYHGPPPCHGTPTRQARKAFNAGLVGLVQKRTAHANTPDGAGDFDYIAYRREDGAGYPKKELLFSKKYL